MSSSRQVCNAVKFITKQPCELAKINGFYTWVDEFAKANFYDCVTPWSKIRNATVEEWVKDYMYRKNGVHND